MTSTLVTTALAIMGHWYVRRHIIWIGRKYIWQPLKTGVRRL